jgi:hypothetical protein
MKYFFLTCLLASGLYVGAQAQQRGVSINSPDKEPLYIIDSVTYTRFNLQYLDPNDIQSISVYKNDSVTAANNAKNGVIKISLKEGHGPFKNVKALAETWPGNENLPKVYLLNGTLILQPDDVYLDMARVKNVEVITSDKIQTTAAKPSPLALVLITFSGEVSPITSPKKDGIILK